MHRPRRHIDAHPRGAFVDHAGFHVPQMQGPFEQVETRVEVVPVGLVVDGGHVEDHLVESRVPDFRLGILPAVGSIHVPDDHSYPPFRSDLEADACINRHCNRH